LKSPIPHNHHQWQWLAVALGVLSFAVVLASFNLTDGDLWAKLALGAHVWLQGSVLPRDVFAFTPVLPEYIDHEWGAGLVFYTCLKWLGPGGLLALKISLAFGALATAMAAGRKLGASWNSLLALAIPCGACLLPAYVPVVRSHAFTFFFFGATLWCLEMIRTGRNWPALVLPPLMLAWANIHGGFVAGLGAAGVYTALALPFFSGRTAASASGRPGWPRFFLLLGVTLACLAVTVINPYGFRFWQYLIPALLNPRLQISEWQPLPVFGRDVFIGFRILFVLVAAILLLAWRQTEKRSWPGLIMLLVTAVISWRSRRHTAFFAVTALALMGPFVTVAWGRLKTWLAAPLGDRLPPGRAVLLLYGGLAFYTAAHFLPAASLQVLTPVGLYPVREVDILSRARAEGNLAVPFRLGSYATWRLYPRIKVSMDGRYETTYPESTFRLNEDFHQFQGTNWDQLIRQYAVDYVILDLHSGKLRPEDLQARGYVLIWRTEGASALMALEKHAAKLQAVAAALPPTTIDPLDARIPETWWPSQTPAAPR